MLAILIYGATRIAMTLLVQVREGMFAKVALHAVRKLALTTFDTSTGCRCAFTSNARPAASRASWSAAARIENISRMVLMTFVPTIVEFVLVLAVCAYEFDWRFVATVFGMIVLYLWFTVQATNWRIRSAAT